MVFGENERAKIDGFWLMVFGENERAKIRFAGESYPLKKIGLSKFKRVYGSAPNGRRTMCAERRITKCVERANKEVRRNALSLAAL